MEYDNLKYFVAKELRINSKRRTPERFIVLSSIINLKDGFTAYDVYNNLKIKQEISLATIYNALFYFNEFGVIHKIPSLDNKIHYKLSDETKQILGMNTN